MSRFVKYLGSAHIDGLNVAVYRSTDGAAVRVENVISGASLGARSFDSVDSVEDWFDGLSASGVGMNMTRLTRAIESITRGRVEF